MDLATRKVVCAGITPYPDAPWILQIGRDLTDAFSGFLLGKRFSSWTVMVRSCRVPRSAGERWRAVWADNFPAQEFFRGSSTLKIRPSFLDSLRSLRIRSAILADEERFLVIEQLLQGAMGVVGD